MKSVIPIEREYEGLPVSFSVEGWINATEIAKRFGKRPVDWLKQDETRQYLAALGEALTCDPESLVTTSRARSDRGGGTWMHPKLGVAFARWLDLRFAVWCDLRIDELLRGEVSAQQQFDKACEALEDRRGLASAQGRGLAQWKYEKQPLEARVEYWKRELQMSLPLTASEVSA
jgi:hypothetical protein